MNKQDILKIEITNILEINRRSSTRNIAKELRLKGFVISHTKVWTFLKKELKLNFPILDLLRRKLKMMNFQRLDQDREEVNLYF